MTTSTTLSDFTSLFGKQPDGCDQARVGHCQESPNIVTRCRAAMDGLTEELFGYFEDWEKSADTNKPFVVEQSLAMGGRWEAAWSLARLHVDQVVKRELATGARVASKGHPLCNVALVGRRIGAAAVVRHYGQLSSAGDIYRAVVGTPAAHGLGPLLLEPHESRLSHEAWRAFVATEMTKQDPTKPLYLEAYLAARWFRGAYRDSVVALAPMTAGRPASFVELLLEEVENWKDTKNTTGQGTLFEAAAGLLLSATPGFTVYPCRWNKDDQIDLVVRYEPDGIAPACLPVGYGLVECKAEKEPVDSATLRDFGAKCQFHRVSFGILVARAGLKDGGARFKNEIGAELARRRFLSDGLTLLVLDIGQLQCQERELRGLHDALFNDYQRLVFGQIVGET
jgi:hypothetical protein